MENKLETYGTIRSGKLSISYRERFVAAISSFKDCRVKITVERIYKKRSLQQNAYLHGYLFPTIHEALKDAGYKIN